MYISIAELTDENMEHLSRTTDIMLQALIKCVAEEKKKLTNDCELSPAFHYC